MKTKEKYCGFCEKIEYSFKNHVLVCPEQKKIVNINDTCEDFIRFNPNKTKKVGK